MFDYRIFYPQIGIDEQNRVRRSTETSSTHRVYRLATERRDARHHSGRR